MLNRYYQSLGRYVQKGKVLIILGPRRVGKTTLLNHFLSGYKGNYRLDTGDNLRLQTSLGSLDFNLINEYAKSAKLIAIDEAQKIPNIGNVLKIIVDYNPEIKVVATGSSSFELAGQTGEPLTGRKRTLNLFPVSALELVSETSNFEFSSRIEKYLIYGMYPAVVTTKTDKEKRVILNEIVDSYLFKDILDFEKIKGAKVLIDLLRLIAFQIGSEVSTTELGGKLGIDYKTVIRYLDLFEKSFILYNLRGYSRNLRKEVYKKSKYYFFDIGIRNAVIGNFNSLEARDDIGRIWENFIVLERIKKQSYKQIYSNNFFWRTWDQQKIDWIEERDGKLFGYEIKWNDKKPTEPPDWTKTYKNASYQVINKTNYLKFIG